MTEQKKPDKKGAGHGLKILLAISLVLNFAVVGLIAGAALRHDGWVGGGKRPPSLGAFGAPYMLALSKEDRRKVLRVLRNGRETGLPDRKARRALYTDVLDALRSSPFDSAALERASSKQAGATLAVQNTAQAAWLEVVAGMSDVERLEYANAVEDILRRGPQRKSK